MRSAAALISLCRMPLGHRTVIVSALVAVPQPAVACILPEGSAVLPESIQVQVPVVVVVNDARAETRIRPQQLWGARIRLKQPVSFVQQECAGSLQSRGKEIHRAVAIEVCY